VSYTLRVCTCQNASFLFYLCQKTLYDKPFETLGRFQHPGIAAVGFRPEVGCVAKKPEIPEFTLC